jgi:hypothetical protein
LSSDYQALRGRTPGCVGHWGRRRGDLRPECIGIALKDLRDGLLSETFILDVIAAAIAIAVLAVLPAREALAVELEAARILAVAVFLATLVG